MPETRWKLPPLLRRPDAAALGVVALFLVLVVATFADYGISWDEKVQVRYGELALRYYASGFRDVAVNEYLDLRFYGPPFEMASAALMRVAPAAGYELRHLLIACTAVLAVLAVGRLAIPLRAGAGLAALALVTLPHFYGHAFINSKDVPLAAAAALFVLAVSRLLDGPTLGAAIPCGVALGLALSLRIGSVLFAGIAAVAVAHSAWLRRTQDPPHRSLSAFGLSLVLAAGVMFATWPWLHEDPIGHPLQALRATAEFPVTYPVLFAGRHVPSNELPADYLVRLLALTVPVPHLALAATGLALSVRRAARSPVHLLVALWLLAPLALFVVLRPAVYDGMRHFLFLLPAVATCCGVATAWAGERWPHRATLPVLALLLLAPVPAMARLHPYQMTYFNALAGGTAGASGRYDTEYWLTSYKEAAEWLESAPCREGPVRVLVATDDYGEPCIGRYLSADRFEVTRTMRGATSGPLPPEWDFYVATTRWDLDDRFPAEPIAHVVGRAGAPFTVIRGSCP